MNGAYLDTSCLVAVAFGDSPGEVDVAEVLEGFPELFSSNLLEAELRAALVREGVGGGESLISLVTWVLPDRPLTSEIRRVLSSGYARGADTWHLAAALYLAEAPADLAFLTLDGRQRELASKLGFPTPL